MALDEEAQKISLAAASGSLILSLRGVDEQATDTSSGSAQKAVITLKDLLGGKPHRQSVAAVKVKGSTLERGKELRFDDSGALLQRELPKAAASKKSVS
jgi:Flp pilus assembly protein CpaB